MTIVVFILCVGSLGGSLKTASICGNATSSSCFETLEERALEKEKTGMRLLPQAEGAEDEEERLESNGRQFKEKSWRRSERKEVTTG